MLNMTNMLRAPAQSWRITMKPTGLHGRRGRGPEFGCTVSGTKAEAARLARNAAEAAGFAGYAITEIKEVSHERRQ